MILSPGLKPLQVSGILYLDFTNKHVGFLESQIIAATTVFMAVHGDYA